MNRDIENEVQIAIRKKVIQHYTLTQQEEEKVSRTEDTLAALAEITGIPKSELEKIADKTREAYERKSQSHKRIRSWISRGIFLVLFVSAVSFASIKLLSIPETKIKYKAVFTTGLDENNIPINSLSSVSLQKKIYFFIRLMELEPGKTYKGICKLYDAEGSMVMDIATKLTPKGVIHNLWFWHNFYPSIEHSGRWKMTFTLEGKKIIEESVNIVP